MQIKNTQHIRQILTEEIELIRNGKSNPARANAIANLTGKILTSAKLDLEVHRYIGKEKPIELKTPLIKELEDI